VRDRTIWAIIIIYALFAGAKPLLTDTSFFILVPAVSILGPILFVLLHAPRQIGWRNLVAFFILATVISWSYESLSIATGFPFGNYHYTDKLGLKLGTVPVLIMPAYFGVCYISWLIARTLTGNLTPEKSWTWPTIVVSAFVMVMWDLSMDPSRATINGVWIWHDGGAYFGVPFINFVGWFLCVATIFGAFGYWLHRQKGANVTVPDGPAQAQALGLYVGLFAEFVSLLFLGPTTGTVTDATGQIWKLRDIYQSLGLVSIFTMGFVILLTGLTLQKQHQDKSASK